MAETSTKQFHDKDRCH